MLEAALHSPLLLCLLTVAFAAGSALLPLSPVEPVLVGVALVAPHWLLLPLAALATASHMAAKTVVYLGGRRALAAVPARHRARVDSMGARLAGRRGAQLLVVLLSAITGLPPFYVVTAMCGALQIPLRDYLLAGTTGRAVRFTGLLFLPGLVGFAA